MFIHIVTGMVTIETVFGLKWLESLPTALHGTARSGLYMGEPR